MLHPFFTRNLLSGSRKTMCHFAFSLGLLMFFAIGTLQSQTIYGLSGNNLIQFDAALPGTLQSTTAITGVGASYTIEGMDFRPNTGELYAIGYNQMSGQAQLYTINTTSGVASPVGAVAMLAANLGKLTFDFNPTVDRIRVMGSSNLNYRLHPTTGAIAATDGNMAFAAGDPNFGVNPSVGTSAYTNSFIGSTSTTLYNYEDSLNVLTSQIPPNNGTLNTIGASGIAVNLSDPTSDLDIWFNPMTSTNIAFLSANVGASTSDGLYTVNLSTGAATLVGMIGGGVAVNDIAAFIDRTVPATVTGNLVYGLTAGNNLVSFDSDLPGIIRNIYAVTGIAAGQVLSGLDVRPNTGELYGIGYNQMTGEAQLYTINPASGAATPVGAIAMLAANLGKLTFDFNPTVDRIRVMGSSNLNYRLHPVTGAIAATDGNMAFAAGDPNFGVNPSVGTSAYTNSFIGSTSTTLYNYEDSLNILTSQIPPNNGTLNTIGSSGLVVNLTDPTSDLDIWFNPGSGMNMAFLAANVGASTFDNLYTINLATGAASSVGKIGNGIAITDIAASINRTVPAMVTGNLVYGLTSGNNLISFDSENPQIIRSIKAVTGVAAGQVLSGLDVRPATGQLYLLGYVQASGMAQLYTIDTMSGAAIAVAPAVTLAANMGKITFDFNPTVDRIRVMGSNNLNYRLHPTTGAIAATDGSLAFAAGDPNFNTDPSIGTSAYTNSYQGTTTTTLYNYDDSLNVFTSQIPPNNGTLNTIGFSALMVNLADPSSDLDIYFDPMNNMNVAYFAANTGTSTFDKLYTVNLTTGNTNLVGNIGNGIAVTDIAAAINVNCNIGSITLSNISNCNGQSTPGIGDDVFTADVTVTFANKPAMGSLNLTGDGTASIMVGSTSGPLSHTFIGVVFPADSSAISLTAAFSADAACTFTNSNAGTAPYPCSGDCFVSINSVTVTDATCSGSGSIVISATGSMAQLAYSINGGATFNLTGEFPNLSPGTYQIVVRIQGDPTCLVELTATVNGGAGDPPLVYFKDLDNDGYSDGVSQTACSQPMGYKLAANLFATNGDCNDNDPLQRPGQTWYQDSDNDGYSNGMSLVQCLKPTGYKAASQLTATNGDCNDNVATIRPGAPELCNGIDDDCDGTIDEGLSDQVFTGNVFLTTQAQVDAFSNCITVINGNLTIRNTGILNLNTLSNLRKVTGLVSISNTSLTNLAGLSTLDSIGGSLTIKTNGQLTSLMGLEDLDRVGGYLQLYYNFKLSDCCAIETLLNTPGGVVGNKVIYYNKTGCDNIAQINMACPGPFMLIAPPTVDGTVEYEGDETLMEVYPNPTSGLINIRLDGSFGAGMLTLYDATGRLVWQQETDDETSQYRFDGQSASVQPGLYLLMLDQAGKARMSTKVVVK